MSYHEPRDPRASINIRDVRNAEYHLSPKYKPQTGQSLEQAVLGISPRPGTHQSISSSEPRSEQSSETEKTRQSPSKTITGSGELQSDQDLAYKFQCSVSENDQDASKNSENSRKSKISDARESDYSELPSNGSFKSKYPSSKRDILLNKLSSDLDDKSQTSNLEFTNKMVTDDRGSIPDTLSGKNTAPKPDLNIFKKKHGTGAWALYSPKVLKISKSNFDDPKHKKNFIKKILNAESDETQLSELIFYADSKIRK
jgi:hypothetical protein